MIIQRTLMFLKNIAFELDFQPNAQSVIYRAMKSGVTRAKVPRLKNLDVLLPRIYAEKWMADTLQDTKKNVWPKAYRGLQTYLVKRSDWA